MSLPNGPSDVRLEAIPAMMGWSIVAWHGGAAFIIERGLEDAEPKLKHWEQNKDVILTAIRKAKSK